VNTVLDVVYGFAVYNAILKVFPTEAKLCVPDSNSTGNENGTIFAIYFSPCY
jgi:uncharacterized membrane protein YpjA